MSPTKSLLVEIPPGELIDKIMILAIKTERISEPEKLANVRQELETLQRARDAGIGASAELSRLADELKSINEELWEIEDDIRDQERDQDFGSRFIELARSVYRTNDRRAAVKRQINELLDSRLTEEKSYAPYADSE